ncbi:putative toxin-antitoxin system toxin component, PIN family [Rugosibacter aromaticivorans]|uniref:putative toxin-antitoxin system toxin component, PIN family n=1 Tax=Rugosibacter aromaticivorans TaxID=1565605 RepID=UPI000A70CA87|nr:putative toxin-antitoxin system toxin component, PIN family [Rugosibacter aromaticivorans]TBR13053.1 MAG: putative toxin-antitoxin system toxin component, PIN family [Rugosibacter sp.]
MTLGLSGQIAASFADQPIDSTTRKSLRVVLDTNVLVSLYVFADSRFTALRERIENGQWCAVSSDSCLAEFERVLAYPQFGLACAERHAAYTHYARCVTLAPTLLAVGAAASTSALPQCQDPDDQKFLEAARDSSADWLVTSDKALLVLARRDRLRNLFRILTPEAALATF